MIKNIGFTQIFPPECSSNRRPGVLKITKIGFESLRNLGNRHLSLIDIKIYYNPIKFIDQYLYI